VRDITIPLLIAWVGIIVVLYSSVGYNSIETITLVHYGANNKDIKTVSDVGFYNKFGSTKVAVHHRNITIKVQDIEITDE